MIPANRFEAYREWQTRINARAELEREQMLRREWWNDLLTNAFLVLMAAAVLGIVGLAGWSMVR